jgi:Domain of Unknown Function (DUF928)
MTKKFTLQTLSVIGLLVASITSNTPVGRANFLQINLATIQFKPPPIPNRGAPGKRGTGASRGECVRSKTPLTALVPSFNNSQKDQDVWGLTTREQPTLWVYVPFARTCSTIEFSLQDDTGTPLYKIPIAAPEKSGIIKVKLPASTPALKPNQMYHWLLQVRVKPKQADDLEEQGELFAVDGWIQRISPSSKLSQQLKQASTKQQARLYAENGIWFDALTTLAELRLANQKDAVTAQDWKSLLQSVGLERFASEPIKILSPNN